MVEIYYKPAEEIVILEMAEYGLKELAKTCVILMRAGRPVILNWADGIAFHHQPLPMNRKELLKERKEGRVYWASVIYAEMPEYRPVVSVGPRDVPVLATPNPLLKQVASWIKKHSNKNNTTHKDKVKRFFDMISSWFPLLGRKIKSYFFQIR